jgi:hypothetical protein
MIILEDEKGEPETAALPERVRVPDPILRFPEARFRVPPTLTFPEMVAMPEDCEIVRLLYPDEEVISGTNWLPPLKLIVLPVVVYVLEPGVKIPDIEIVPEDENVLAPLPDEVRLAKLKAGIV